MVRIVRDWLVTVRELLLLELTGPPALVQLSLVDVKGLYMPPQGRVRINPHAVEQEYFSTEPWILDSWGEGSKEDVRRMMDTVWQAFGVPGVPKATLEERGPWWEWIWPED